MLPPWPGKLDSLTVSVPSLALAWSSVMLIMLKSEDALLLMMDSTCSLMEPRCFRSVRSELAKAAGKGKKAGLK